MLRACDGARGVLRTVADLGGGSAAARCRGHYAPLVSDYRYVFVTGLHRSGTSLLARCIAQHPQVSGFSGTGVPEDEGQLLQSVYPPGSTMKVVTATAARAGSVSPSASI